MCIARNLNQCRKKNMHINKNIIGNDLQGSVTAIVAKLGSHSPLTLKLRSIAYDA